MQLARTTRAPTDGALNRAIVAVLLILAIGVPSLGAVYLLDRWVASGPTLAERRTEQLEANVRNAPNDVSQRLLLVGAYLTGNRVTDAIAQLDEILRVAPNHKNALVTRGSVYQKQGNLDAASRDYQAVVDEMKGQEFAGQDRDLESAYFGLGQIALSRGRPSDAIASFTSALRIDRANADTLYALGTAYISSGRASDAIQPLRQAVDFVPAEWPDPYRSLAVAYSDVGDQQEASWATAMAEFASSQPEKAKAELLALTNGTAATDAYLGLGMIAEKQGDLDAASDAYSRVLANDPQSFNAQQGIARIRGVQQMPATPAPSQGTH